MDIDKVWPVELLDFHEKRKVCLNQTPRPIKAMFQREVHMNWSTSSSSEVEHHTGFYYNLRLRLCLLLVSLRSILLGNDVLVLVKKSKKHHLILPFKSIFFKNCSVSFSDPSCNYFFVISFACFASKVVVAMIFQITFNSSSFFVLFHLRFKSITGTRTRKLKLAVFFRLNGLI